MSYYINSVVNFIVSYPISSVVNFTGSVDINLLSIDPVFMYNMTSVDPC